MVLRREVCQVREEKNKVGAGGLRRSLGTANVGSLVGKVQGLAHVSDMVCVQESMVSRSRERAIRGEASSAGFQYFSGSPAAEKNDSLGRRGPAKGQGLAVLCKEGSQWFGLDRQLGGTKGVGKRLHSGWLLFGTTALILHNVYCRTSLQDSWARDNNDLIGEILRRVEIAPSEAQVIAGDFQTVPHGIQAFAPLIQTGWMVTSQWPTVRDLSTNRAFRGSDRHLDGFLVSPALLPLISDVAIRELEGMSSHSAVVLTLDDQLEESHAKALVPPILPARVPGPDKCASAWQTKGDSLGGWLDSLDAYLYPDDPRSHGKIGRVSLEVKPVVPRGAPVMC